MSETALLLENDLQLLSLREVSAILRVAAITVYRLIAKKALPTFRVGRKILFKKQDVLDYVKRSRSGPPDPDDYGHKKG